MTCQLIIVNWNSWDMLIRCLEALDKQTFKDFGVFVIDNASACPVPDGIVSRYPRVVLIENAANLGFAAANNQGLKRATSEFIGLLNPDAFPEPEWLESLLTAANEHPDVVAFGSRQLYEDNIELLDGIGDVYHISGLVWREGHGRRQRPTDLIPREIFSPCAAAALYRRRSLLEAGGFDEDYFCYLEDVDLGFRLRLRGHKAIYVPRAIVRHIGSATTGGVHSDFAIYHGHRNLVWTYVKNMPGALFWILLPVHLAVNLATIGWWSLKGKGHLIFRAKRDAIRGLRRMWAKRIKIQGSRVASASDIWRQLDKRTVLSPKERQTA